MYKELTLYLYTYLMAESQKGYGQILGDSRFEFSLDGLASYSQLKKLISLTEALAKKAGADTVGPTKEGNQSLLSQKPINYRQIDKPTKPTNKQTQPRNKANQSTEPRNATCDT